MIRDKWRMMPFDQAVLVNPSVRLERGQIYPFVDMQAVDISSRSVEHSGMRKFQGGGSRFASGDTLLARITPCLENGKIARYVASAVVTVGHGSTEFIVIRGRPNVTDNEYAYYLTIWDEVRQFAISQMTGSSGRQRVPIDALSLIEVPLPPLPEQRAIAHILGTLDDKIELNRRMNETLEAMARAIFKSWFVDFDPVRWNMQRKGSSVPADCPLSPELLALFPDSFEDSELGEIPKGWKVKGLDEIADFLNGLALQKYPAYDDDFLPVVKIAQLRRDNTEGADKATIQLDPAYIVDDGDVLFSWSGSLECVLWTGGRGALNQHLFRVTSRIHSKWFYYLWIHEHLDNFRHIAAGKATTMGHIQRQHLSDAKVLIPHPKLLAAVNNVIAPMIDRIIHCRVESRRIVAVRDSLLPKLISGELRVADAERMMDRCV